MPRRIRMYLPGLPYHVVQRGNNRSACFAASDDYRFYLSLWEALAPRYGVSVHAWCLMTNHVHFLITPEDESSVSVTMKIVGSRYAQYVNKKYCRTGTLWEGRHRSSLVQSDRYFLTCMRYIELNPVRAGLVRQPKHYPWSSYGCNALGRCDWLSPHPIYQELGSTSAQRRASYRKLFGEQLSEKDLQLIRDAVHYCQPVCDDEFRHQIQSRYGIPFGQMHRGRPAKRQKGDGGINN